MGDGERLRVGQRVRHHYAGVGLGTVIEDTGEPEERGAYVVRYDNGECYPTSRAVLETVPDDRPNEVRG